MTAIKDLLKAYAKRNPNSFGAKNLISFDSQQDIASYYTRKGYVVNFMNEKMVQLSKKKTFSFGWALLWIILSFFTFGVTFLFLILQLLMYLGTKDTIVTFEESAWSNPKS